jgi:hypothetical protein
VSQHSTIDVKEYLNGKHILFFVPPPLYNSGGHRTIYRHVNFLSDNGAQVEVCISDPGKRSASETEIRKAIFDWFGILKANISVEKPYNQRPDVVIATSWWTAFEVVNYKAPSVYFVQDLENLFNPANEIFAKAHFSYQLGIDTITIGDWLKFEVEKLGSRALSTPFGIDKKFYFRDQDTLRQKNKVVILDQPEKSRRCHDLLQETCDYLGRNHPELEIFSYGTSSSFLKGVTSHLGSLNENQLGQLYRESSIGVILSVTNPSRIPFEMAACGLPFIDLDLPNNKVDYNELSHLLAAPFPSCIGKAVIERISKAYEIKESNKAISIQEELHTFSENLIWFLENQKNSKSQRFVLDEEILPQENKITLYLKKGISLRLKLWIKKWTR